MKIPKERLKEIYDEYLEENQKRFNSKRELHPFILLTFWEYLEFVRYKDKTEHLPLLITSECGFSTTSECRKAINELENWQPVSDKITDSTKNSGYTVYIPESAKKSEKQETWQDILKEFEKTIVDSEFMYSSLRQFLVKNFEVPKRK